MKTWISRYLLALVLIVQMTAAAEPNQKIDHLAARLTSDSFWKNGTYPNLELPESADINTVISKALSMTRIGDIRITDFKIIETKTVKIRGSLPDTYTAARMDTKAGELIMLLQYRGHWWTRIFGGDAGQGVHVIHEPRSGPRASPP